LEGDEPDAAHLIGGRGTRTLAVRVRTRGGRPTRGSEQVRDFRAGGRHVRDHQARRGQVELDRSGGDRVVRIRTVCVGCPRSRHLQGPAGDGDGRTPQF